jgi:hypothetical protein
VGIRRTKQRRKDDMDDVFIEKTQARFVRRLANLALRSSQQRTRLLLADDHWAARKASLGIQALKWFKRESKASKKQLLLSFAFSSLNLSKYYFSRWSKHVHGVRERIRLGLAMSEALQCRNVEYYFEAWQSHHLLVRRAKQVRHPKFAPLKSPPLTPSPPPPRAWWAGASSRARSVCCASARGGGPTAC